MSKSSYFHQKVPPRKLRHTYSTEAQLSTMETAELVGGINNLIRALRRKGIHVVDYDNRERRLYKVLEIRGGLCFLAAEETDGDKDN